MIKDKIHAPAEETGKEKHVPFIELHGDKIKVSCGKDIMHPSTAEHYIGWIKLYGLDKEGLFRELGSANPTPGITNPVAVFAVDGNNYKELHALIYCNVHGLWENTLVI